MIHDSIDGFRKASVGEMSRPGWARVFVDAAGVQVISAADEQWIHPFTGYSRDSFRKLVRLVAKRGGDQIAPAVSTSKSPDGRHG